MLHWLEMVEEQHASTLHQIHLLALVKEVESENRRLSNPSS